MNRQLVQAIIFLTALFVADLSYGQQPAPSPNATSTTSAEDVKKKEAESTPSAVTSEPAVTPAPDFWHQETMTGDWGGARSRWKEKGVELEFKLTQFFQGVTSGGTRRDSEYNGTFEYALRFDLEKVAGWKFWSSDIKAEIRFGGPLLGGTGGINPVNTAAIIPGADGEVISVTAVNFTRIIPKDLKKGDLFAISFGRFNLLDLSDEQFFGGAGKERFFNIAHAGRWDWAMTGSTGLSAVRRISGTRN